MPDSLPPRQQAHAHSGLSRHRQLVVLLLRGRTWRVSCRASLLVGTVLTAVNQGDHVIAGDVDLVSAVRIVANFAIPYVVAGFGYLTGYRTHTVG